MEQIRCIVTGIDFSGASLNGIVYAAELCAALNASLIIVHGYRAQSRSGFAFIDRHTKNALREEIKRAIKPIKDSHPDLHIEEVVRRAEPKDALLWATKKYHAQIIVLGAQGEHASKDVFIGSTTGALIKVGDTPVLAIPVTTVFKPFDKVVFAVKHPYVAAREVLDAFLVLTTHFNSRVDLLHITHDSMPDLSRYPNPYPIVPHTYALHTSETDNMHQGISAYLKDNEADLLVVINRLKGFFEGLFAQSSTSISAFNAELPILALHGGSRDRPTFSS